MKPDLLRSFPALLVLLLLSCKASFDDVKQMVEKNDLDGLRGAQLSDDVLYGGGKNGPMFSFVVAAGTPEALSIFFDKGLDIARLDRYYLGDWDPANETEPPELEENTGPSAQPLSAVEHVVRYSGNSEFLRLLIEKGADIEQRDVHGHNPLQVAVLLGRVPYVELLLQHGASISTTKYSSLHLAAAKNEVAIGRMLVDHGVDVNQVDSRGKTALQILIDQWLLRETTSWELAEILAEAGARGVPLWVDSPGGLWMRSEPSAKGERIRLVPTRQEVELLYGSYEKDEVGGYYDYWYRVRALGREGWVYGAYLLTHAPLTEDLAVRDIIRKQDAKTDPLQAEWDSFRGELRTVAGTRPFKMNMATFTLYGEEYPVYKFEIEVRVFSDTDHIYQYPADDHMETDDAIEVRDSFYKRLKENDGIERIDSIPWAVTRGKQGLGGVLYDKYEHHFGDALVSAYFVYYTDTDVGPFRGPFLATRADYRIATPEGWRYIRLFEELLGRAYREIVPHVE